MAETQPTQAAGGDGRQGAPDGVENPSGKTGGGESAGGGYPRPEHPEASGGEQGFMGHGGQSDINYSGAGGGNYSGAGGGGSDTDDEVGNVNAPTRGES